MQRTTKSRSGSPLGMVRTFLSVWSALRWGRRVRQLPLVFLRITDRCNSRCRGCDTWVARPDSPPELTTQEVLGLIPALRNLRTRVVAILGGEPTVRKDLEECIHGFRQAGLNVQIHSNGLAITPDRAASLARAGLSVARISCDHVTAEGYRAIRGVDGFDRAVAAMRSFRALPEPIPVSVNVVVSRFNMDVLEQFPDRAKEWGIQRLQFVPIHNRMAVRMGEEPFAPMMPRAEDLPRIKASLKAVAARLRELGIGTNSSYYINHMDRAYGSRGGVRCAAGSFAVVVTAFGEVVPCYPWFDAPSLPNIRQMPLDELVRSEAFEKLRHCVRTCTRHCWDQGETEPSLLFHMPYLLGHPLEVLRQVRFNS